MMFLMNVLAYSAVLIIFAVITINVVLVIAEQSVKMTAIVELMAGCAKGILNLIEHFHVY